MSGARCDRPPGPAAVRRHRLGTVQDAVRAGLTPSYEAGPPTASTAACGIRSDPPEHFQGCPWSVADGSAPLFVSHYRLYPPRHDERRHEDLDDFAELVAGLAADLDQAAIRPGA